LLHLAAVEAGIKGELRKSQNRLRVQFETMGMTLGAPRTIPFWASSINKDAAQRSTFVKQQGRQAEYDRLAALRTTRTGECPVWHL
jgi:hypothetical protein